MVGKPWSNGRSSSSSAKCLSRRARNQDRHDVKTMMPLDPGSSLGTNDGILSRIRKTSSELSLPAVISR